MSNGSDDNDTSTDHVLLTGLGTSHEEATYSLGDGTPRVAQFAPVALLDMLPSSERPRRVVALCTAEAESRSFPMLVDALGPGQSVERVRIPDGDQQEHIDTFLATVADAIPQGAEITVDVTHGPRSFSFLMYAAVLYMAALRNVRVRGAYYAMLSRSGPSPFLDLRPLLDLPRWVYALRVLEETGSTRPLAEILKQGPGNEAMVSKIASDFDDLGKDYLSGLPLELGRGATQIGRCHRRTVRRLLIDDYKLPRADALFDRLREVLERFAFPEHCSGEGWKMKIELTRKELKRQASIVDHLLGHGNTATGLGLMNEWTRTWAAYRIAESPDWLHQKKRQKASARLHAISVVGDDPDLRDDFLDKDQRRLGAFWKNLCNVRNTFNHYGMRPEDAGGNEFAKKLDHVRTYWDDVLRSCPNISLTLGDPTRNRVLVSPIGERPGVLFSAVEAFRTSEQGDPTLCLVVCSAETQGMVDEALSKAGCTGSVELLVLDDPFQDVKEMREKAKSMRRHFIGADPVIVNVTGGTTLMGFAIQELAKRARGFACPVRRFGLIDRRTPEEQVADPYRAGELFWLDPQEDEDAGN